MRILMMTPWLPGLPTTGGSPRVFHLLKELAPLHDFTVYSLSSSAVECARFTGAVDRDCLRTPVHVVNVDRSSSLAGFLRTTFSMLPNFIMVHKSPAEYKRIQGIVRMILERDHFDLIHIENISMLQYLPARCRIPKVVMLPDSAYLYFRRNIRYGGSLFKRIWFCTQAMKAKRFETTVLGDADYVVVNSDIDARVLLSNGLRNRVAVVPNGVDIEYYSSKPRRSSGNAMVFSGVMDYEYNVDAMLYFCRDILPIIRKEVPDASLLIVGKNPTGAILDLAANSSINVTGYVDDVRPYVSRATVYVSPLRGGAGMKNKLLMAMAMQRPIVASSISCDGIDIEHNHSALIADAPAAFAQSVVALLHNEALRRRLVRNAFNLAKEKYSWRSYARRFDQIYLRSVSTQGSAFQWAATDIRPVSLDERRRNEC